MYHVKVSAAFPEGRAFIESYGAVGAVKPRTVCHAPMDAIDKLISECPSAVLTAPMLLGGVVVEKVAESKPETPEEPVVEAKACVAFTKSGNPCKGKAYEGDYCNFHS